MKQYTIAELKVEADKHLQRMRENHISDLVYGLNRSVLEHFLDQLQIQEEK